jgi:hypothetical protein
MHHRDRKSTTPSTLCQASSTNKRLPRVIQTCSSSPSRSTSFVLRSDIRLGVRVGVSTAWSFTGAELRKMDMMLEGTWGFHLLTYLLAVAELKARLTGPPTTKLLCERGYRYTIPRNGCVGVRKTAASFSPRPEVYLWAVSGLQTLWMDITAASAVVCAVGLGDSSVSR